MPFTLAHPSVVLVLRKIFPVNIFSLTALVAGSIAPDFEGFILLQTKKTFSHTWQGLFLFDLPMGLFICLVWHNLVKRPFIDNVPQYLKRRFYVFRDFNWNGYLLQNKLIVVTSLIIGIITHLEWDEFTHFNGTDYTAVVIFNHEMSYFICLQAISSISGLIILILSISYMPPVRKIPLCNSFGYWFLIFEVSIVFLFIRVLIDKKHLTIPRHVYESSYDIISGILLSLLVTSLIYKTHKHADVIL